MNYQTQQTLSDISVLFLILGFLVLVMFGIAFLTDYENVGIEARCIELGGQVIKNPGDLSSCILPSH